MASNASASWDVLNQPSTPGFYWTTTNVGEAAPGVLTPLCWSIWRGAVDRGFRHAAYGIGVLNAGERDQVEPPLTQIFAGRIAVNVDFLALLGDRSPGTTGQEVVRSAFGRVPEDMRFAKTRRRYPVVAVRFPATFFTIRRQMLVMAQEYGIWWREATARAETADLDQARDLLRIARRKFHHAATIQSVGTLAGVQPAYDAATRLIDLLGTSSVAEVTAVPGGVEMHVVADIWRASRGQLTAEEVADRHGFHGPGEGEVSNHVWRENLEPLRKTIDLYAKRPDTDDPDLHASRLAADHRALERRLLAGTTWSRRLIVKAILALVRSRVPMRGVGKRSFLQALDVCRASARRIGIILEAENTLEAADDVFYLTADELISGAEDLRELVIQRRARRESYRTVEIPSQWREQPELTPIVEPVDPTEPATSIVTGVGVSGGVVEGRARVLLTPDFDDVEEDEILVAPFTDPSWSSIMFVSTALVVDIGGSLSHTAVVARELEIPCVVNTKTGTKQIRTGDTVRVDGTAGTVEILERAPTGGDGPVPC